MTIFGWDRLNVMSEVSCCGSRTIVALSDVYGSYRTSLSISLSRKQPALSSEEISALHCFLSIPAADYMPGFGFRQLLFETLLNSVRCTEPYELFHDRSSKHWEASFRCFPPSHGCVSPSRACATCRGFTVIDDTQIKVSDVSRDAAPPQPSANRRLPEESPYDAPYRSRRSKTQAADERVSAFHLDVSWQDSGGYSGTALAHRNSARRARQEATFKSKLFFCFEL